MRYGNIKVFGKIPLFAYVDMYTTKYIIPETASFIDKLIHHEERYKHSTWNINKFTNSLTYNIESVKYTFTFK